MPRNRTAKSAVLGLGVRRPAPRPFPSRSRSALRRRIVLGTLVLLSLALITASFRERPDGPLHDAQGAVAGALQPLEVAIERVARPFRDAYGWTKDLFNARVMSPPGGVGGPADGQVARLVPRRRRPDPTISRAWPWPPAPTGSGI